MSSRNYHYIVTIFYQLYQIGIRCLAATTLCRGHSSVKLYQIGIRCLAATVLPRGVS